jgi:TorA maturation chaperone TorD
MDISETVLEDRYDNYATLSRLFRSEIDSDLLALMVASPAAEKTGDGAVDTANAQLRDYLDAVTDLAKTKSLLAIDYALTFLGYGASPDDDGFGNKAAYPYEGLYVVGSQGFAKVGDSVSQLFKQAGFRYTKDRTAMPDHIAHELEYMQFITGLELLAVREGKAEQVQGYLAQQLDFLEEHLLKWTPAFAQEIKRFSQSGFYQALADLLLAYLNHDHSFLVSMQQETRDANQLLGGFQ